MAAPVFIWAPDFCRRRFCFGMPDITPTRWASGTSGANQRTDPGPPGFTRNFNLLDGAGTHFDAVSFSERGSIYNRDGRSFFAFAAYTSPHWPLQVPDDYLELYAGAYDDGYDVLREQRFESLKEDGNVRVVAGFELFDVVADPGESTDLSQSEPEQYEAMLELWREERRRLGIILPLDI
jgi:arylsulfatase A-like enzyme